MIIDSIRNASFYYGLSDRLMTGLKFLQKSDWSKMESGRQEIDGQDIYALVSCYESKPVEKEIFEAHRRYIDIHYVVWGSECMGYASMDAVETTTEYDSEKDFQLFEGRGDVLTVHEGMFVLFAPQDAHMPGISPGQADMVKKAVVKVRV